MDLGLDKFLLDVGEVQRGLVRSVEPDLDQLVKLLIDWIACYSDFRTLMSNAQAVALRQFTIETTTDRLLDFLEEMNI